MSLGGWRSFSLSMSCLHILRSSARWMAEGGVPKMWTPASASGTERFSGVWPPSCTMMPSGCSRRMMLSRSSSVSGSK